MRGRSSAHRQSPYAALVSEEMILRDYLAADRTALANERTFLAYARTALACMVTGVSIVHFIDGAAADVTGLVLVVVGGGTATLGVVRYLRMRVRLTGLDEIPTEPGVRARLRAERDGTP